MLILSCLLIISIYIIMTDIPSHRLYKFAFWLMITVILAYGIGNEDLAVIIADFVAYFIVIGSIVLVLESYV